jgi:hypothetical protein
MKEFMKEFGGFKVGGRVKFTKKATKEEIAWGSNDDPNELLVLGSEYTVASIEVHSFHTKLYLEGVEGRFNTGSFEPCEDEKDGK